LQPQDLVLVDELTEIYNRRYYTAHFPDMAVRATHTGEPLCIAVLDFDYFKAINDTYGHHAGDQVLQGVGRKLRDICERVDAAAVRWGGDEFIMIFQNVDRARCLELLDELLDDLRANPFVLEDGRELRLSFSAGMASFPEDVGDPQKLFDAADEAVYRSKKEGRSRISTGASSGLSFSKDNFHRLFPCPKLIGRSDIVSQVKPLLLQPDIERPIVALSGPSGVGKSRLMETFQSMVDAQRFAVIQAKCFPHLINQPYGALLEGIRYALRSDSRLAHRIASAIPPQDVVALMGVLPDIVSVGLLTTDKQQEVGPEQVSAAISRVLLALADGRPLCIFMDDMQYCEPGSVSVLDQLKAGPQGKNVLVVCGLRKTDEQQFGGEGHKSVIDFIVNAMKSRALLPIEVEPLSWHHVRDMIAAIIPPLKTNDRLIQVVTQKSKALPLLVEEILKFLIQQEFITCANGEVEVKEINEEDIPARIEEILELRSASLAPEVRKFVSRAAVVGQKFDLATLKELDGTAEGELLESIDKGVRTSFFQLDNADEVRFTSDDAQEVLYEQVDKRERQIIHRKVAEIEEKRAPVPEAVAARLAWHFERAGDARRAAAALDRLQRFEVEPREAIPAPPLGGGQSSAIVKQIGEDMAVLVKDLESGDPQKITNAVSTLVGGGEAIFEPLLGLVSSTDDLRARRLALYCLNQTRCPTVDRLLVALHRTQDYAEKCRLITALAEFREPRLSAELGGFVRFPEATVRRAALRVLEAFHTETAQTFIREAMSDKDEGVQEDAIASLGRLRSKAAVPDLVQLIRRRTIFVFEKQQGAQRQACLALGTIADSSAVQALILALRPHGWWTLHRTKNAEVRAAAAMALSGFEGAEVDRELERASHDANHTVRSAAKVALARRQHADGPSEGEAPHDHLSTDVIRDVEQLLGSGRK
jgi:diguanylate cyclase (GGDEF)-like protein